MARYILDIPDKTIAHIRTDYGHGVKWINEEDRKILVELIYNAKPINEINWLKEQIEHLKYAQDSYRMGMLQAFEMCLKQMEESEESERE